MKNIAKASKASKTRTNQWKFSDFDEQEREEAALSSLLRKKKPLTPKNVELEIEALMEAEMRANPQQYREKGDSSELLEMKNGLGLLNFELKQHELLIRQQVAATKQAARPPVKKKKASKKAAATTQSPKAFAKKALYDAKSSFKAVKKAQKVRKAAEADSSERPFTNRRSAAESKKIAKRAALKARNERYTLAEKETKKPKGYADRHTTRPASRAKKANSNFKETKAKKEIVAKPLTQEQRAKKLKKRIPVRRNPPSFH